MPRRGSRGRARGERASPRAGPRTRCREACPWMLEEKDRLGRGRGIRPAAPFGVASPEDSLRRPVVAQVETDRDLGELQRGPIEVPEDSVESAADQVLGRD